MELTQIVEALLIASPDPISAKALAKCIRTATDAESDNADEALAAFGKVSEDEILGAIIALNDQYVESGRAFLIAEQMRRKGVKGKLVLLDANPGPLPPPIAKPLLNGIKKVYAAEIDYIPNAGLTAVDIGRRTLATAMGDVPFTEANLVLPQRAPALIRQAGLGERFAAVKLPSFQSQADEKIYVIGDSAGVPLPKSGHVAFGTGVQVAQDIARRIDGKPAPAPGGAVALPAGICWAAVTHDQAAMINVAATLTPGQPPKLAFQVDPEHNAASGKGSMEWGRQMWGNMLG